MPPLRSLLLRTIAFIVHSTVWCIRIFRVTHPLVFYHSPAEKLRNRSRIEEKLVDHAV